LVVLPNSYAINSGKKIADGGCKIADIPLPPSVIRNSPSNQSDMSNHPSSAISHPLSAGGAKRLPTPVRITEQTWPEGTVPVVSIWCITYNHGEFIRDTIEGFLMQETTFPVEILIHDDASTDGTADIVREYQAKYPQLFRTVLQTQNQWAQGIKPRSVLRPLVRGEFIAFCEGDDYWTSALKLAEQESILRQDERVAIVSHGVQYVDESGNPLPGGESLAAPPGSSINYIDIDVLRACYDHPNTWLFRANLFDDKCEAICLGLPMADDPMSVYLLQEGRIGVSLGKVWSAYRQHGGGIWSQRSSFEKRVQELVLYRRHQTVYGERYYAEYDALIAQNRATLAAIVLANLHKLKIRCLVKDLVYVANFASQSFEPFREALAIIYAALITGVLRLKKKVCCPDRYNL